MSLAAVPVSLRAAAATDVLAIANIYADQIATGTSSFEYEPPTIAEMRRRYEGIVAAYFVAEDGDGAVIGYSFASAYRLRPGYRYTVEDSVYVARAAGGRGTGRALLSRLIEACSERGDRLMVAVIGDVANAASIALHRALGFTEVGRMPGVGWKFGRWIESVLMQRPLGAGATRPPR
ncbi:MAG: N-acetyltransferase family protein [Betaproteobacteria bacterium]|nr:MAG: N-acetyltransferase family protein [Betaproteobacteria bacterium]